MITTDIWNSNQRIFGEAEKTCDGFNYPSAGIFAGNDIPHEYIHLYKPLIDRSRFGFMTLSLVIATIVEPIFTIPAVVLNILTLGRIKFLNSSAKFMSNENQYSLSRVFISVLHIVNPKASTESAVKYDRATNATKRSRFTFRYQVEGRLCGSGKAVDIYLAILRPLARLADLAIAPFAVGAAFLTLGTFPTINGYAFATLQPLGILYDINELAMEIIGPSNSW